MKNIKNQGFLRLQKTGVFRSKGISPLIATVILVGVAIVLFGVVFFWLRGLVSEQVMKFDKPIEQQCDNIVLSAKAEGNKVYISNQGNIPIVGINVKIKTDGKTITRSVKKPVSGVIGPGKADVIDVSDEGFDFAGAQERTITPLIQGKTVTSNKMQRYLCKTKAMVLK